MNKLIIILNVAALILAGTVGWIFRGQLAAGQAAKRQLAELENGVGALAGNKVLLAEVDELAAPLQAYFVNRRSLSRLIESLEAAATTTGVALQLTAADAQRLPAGPVVRLSLSATGSFTQVTRYLAALEVLPYELVFQNGSLAPLAAAGRSTVWQLQASIDLLSYHDDEN